MTTLLCTLAGFLLGSLPFSAWILRRFRRIDIRKVGDGNPGAVNAWSAGGWRIGVTVLVLDVAKAAAAPTVARSVFGLEGWPLVPVALAPVFGHVFSPWLRFRGGKGIASTFGVWSALTYWLVPTSLGLGLGLIMQVQSTASWTVVFSSALALVVLVVVRPEPPLLVAFFANVALLVWTHRKELHGRPRFHVPRRRARQ
jgi:glycerol-3-phosphate acyltransferase PlsY